MKVWLPDESLNDVKSGQTPVYNCIAWALGDCSQVLWPVGVDGVTTAGTDWPEEVPRELTISSFDALFARYAFVECPDQEGNLDEPSETHQKIALYTKGEQPSHAARQLRTGRWTSKLGPLADVEHKLPEHVECEEYGRTRKLYCRPWPEGWVDPVCKEAKAHDL